MEDFIQIIERWLKAVEIISRMQLSDAEKEFNISSQIGYGLFEDSKCSGADFKAVRGSFEDDSFIIEIKAVLKSKKKNAFELIEKLKNIAN